MKHKLVAGLTLSKGEMMVPNINQPFSIAKALAQFGIEINSISTNHFVNDSRSVSEGDIFAATIGTEQNGTIYIDSAIEQGASLVLAQCLNAQQHGQVGRVYSNNKQADVIQFFDLDAQLAKLSALYYQKAYEDMQIIGVTGTNGKTSCCQLIAQLCNLMGLESAIIGTLGAGQLNKLQPLKNTTPGPTQLQSLFAQFKQEKVEQVAMEVSSHALSQNRIDANMVDIAVFTNLSRDHLDYHGDMQQYAAAKKQLFNGNEQQIWVLNADDSVGRQWLTELADNHCKVAFSLKGDTFVNTTASHFLAANNIVCHNQGVTFSLTSSWGNCDIQSALLGEFNVANLLAAMATLLVQGIELDAIIKHTNALVPVTGRMETYGGNGLVTAVVDYAHTPDGLEKSLLSAKAHCQGKLWVVFGCGGDRDTGKRAIMGTIAEQFADHIVLTNDNPRSEQPEHITEQIQQGIAQKQKVEVIIDRQQAVISALSRANANDMVLLAGKGHEDYLIIGDQTIAYHERDVVRNFYQDRAHS